MAKTHHAIVLSVAALVALFLLCSPSLAAPLVGLLLHGLHFGLCSFTSQPILIFVLILPRSLHYPPSPQPSNNNKKAR